MESTTETKTTTVSEEAKEKLFKATDRITELKLLRDLFGELSEEQDLELRNLEVKKMQYYSEWKD